MNDSDFTNDMTQVKLVSHPTHAIVNSELDKSAFQDASITETEKMFAEGYQFLLQMSDERNTVSLEEFKKFLPLYRRSELGSVNRFSKELKAYNALSDEFEFRFDLTKPIKIVDTYDRNKVICVFPPVRREFDMIGKDVIEIFDRFKSRSDSDRPDYSGPATVEMVNALVKSQNLNIDTVSKAKAVSMKMEVEALRRVNPDNPVLKLFETPEQEQTSTSESKLDDTVEEKDVVFDL